MSMNYEGDIVLPLTIMRRRVIALPDDGFSKPKRISNLISPLAGHICHELYGSLPSQPRLVYSN
jgi:hypothetical protein